MDPFSLLIKPASDSCNLRCSYCFYRKKTPFNTSDTHVMPDVILEKLIKTFLSTPQPCHIFTWQGGEPTLLGSDFFARVIELQQRYAQEGAVIANGLQTNGTMLDERLCSLLVEYNFLVGCSLDGPAVIHDMNRQTVNGEPSHDMVIHGLDTLQRAGGQFNIMTLVSRTNVGTAEAVYSYFREKGYGYQQYIPCVELDYQGNLLPYAIDGQEWGAFLCDLFDMWYPQDVGRVSIRLFDSILAKLVYDRLESCTMDSHCKHYLVVEYNGDVYPCDFYVKNKFNLGNFLQSSWEAIFNSESFDRFSHEKSNLEKSCRMCDFLFLCGGDCIRNRPRQKYGPKPSILCEGWKKFFNKTLPIFNRLAKSI